MTKDQLEKANHIIHRISRLEGELKEIVGEDDTLGQNPNFFFPKEMIARHKDEKIKFLEKEINKLKEEFEHL